MASNTAVVRSLPTYKTRMLIPATCACSLCLRAACGNTTKDSCICTNKFADFLKTDLVTYIFMVFLGIHIIMYGMGICVFELVKSSPTSSDTVSPSSTFSTLTKQSNPEDVACHHCYYSPRVLRTVCCLCRHHQRQLCLAPSACRSQSSLVSEIIYNVDSSILKSDPSSGLLWSRFPGLCGWNPMSLSPLSSDFAGCSPVRESPRTKIRGESSSNGSEIAECRVHSAKNPS